MEVLDVHKSPLHKLKLFQTGQKALVALPLGVESCFHINSLKFRRVDY